MLRCRLPFLLWPLTSVLGTHVHFQKVESELLEFWIQSSINHFFLHVYSADTAVLHQIVTEALYSPVHAGSPQLSPGSQAARPESTRGCHSGLCSALSGRLRPHGLILCFLLSGGAGPAYAVTFYLGRSFTINSWQHLSWAPALLQPGTKFGLTLTLSVSTVNI